MNEHEDPILVAAAEAVTDGMSVDWAGLRTRNPALARQLTGMEALAEVAEAYQTLRSKHPSPET